jgi:thiopeptide-type bacteriocin biosynthesis protein
MWETIPRLIASGLRRLGRESRFDFRLEPYVPEIDRYGGLAGMQLAQDFFHADSSTAVDLLSLVPPSDDARTRRWALLLASLDRLVRDLQSSRVDGEDLAVDLRDRYHREFEGSGNRVEIGRLFRRHRSDILTLDDPAARVVLGRRSKALRPIAAEFRRMDRRANLSRPWSDIRRSLVHMHLSRMVESGLREHELILYDFLVRRNLWQRSDAPPESRPHRHERRGDAPTLTLRTLAD